MFLPTTHEEMIERGWTHLDIILITSDAYIDSPYMGVSTIHAQRTRRSRYESHWGGVF